MSKNTPWRAEDDAYLRAHYSTQPTAAVAAHLQHTARHVQQRAYDLGVKKAPGAKTLRTGRWTDLDDLLQLLYADMSNEDLGELLGMRVQDIATGASRLGLHKSPGVLTQTYHASMLWQGRRHGPRISAARRRSLAPSPRPDPDGQLPPRDRVCADHQGFLDSPALQAAAPQPTVDESGNNAPLHPSGTWRGLTHRTGHKDRD
ncbi:hypothetical protein EDF72_5115 [Delftia acidovorans]|uniref:hypothetical protein n=1 Tax=Delftia acidovorans TaxID=80866 RepID=UPI000FB64C92|nr:hypothetical protein [Delftia acidovorans]ROQ90110.1 hypothetical protein EDF72_5115 [Delftia acidovorans]